MPQLCRERAELDRNEGVIVGRLAKGGPKANYSNSRPRVVSLLGVDTSLSPLSTQRAPGFYGFLCVRSGLSGAKVGRPSRQHD